MNRYRTMEYISSWTIPFPKNESKTPPSCPVRSVGISPVSFSKGSNWGRLAVYQGAFGGRLRVPGCDDARRSAVTVEPVSPSPQTLPAVAESASSGLAGKKRAVTAPDDADSA